jgi:hypothetical protein
MFLLGDQSEQSDTDLRARMDKLYDNYFESCMNKSPENNESGVHTFSSFIDDIFCDLNLEKVMLAFVACLFVYKLLRLAIFLVRKSLAAVFYCIWRVFGSSKLVLNTTILMFTAMFRRTEHSYSNTDAQVQTSTIEETMPLKKEIYINFKHNGDNEGENDRENSKFFLLRLAYTLILFEN